MTRGLVESPGTSCSREPERGWRWRRRAVRGLRRASKTREQLARRQLELGWTELALGEMTRSSGKKKCDPSLRFTTHRCYPASLHPAAQSIPCGSDLRHRQNQASCDTQFPSPFEPGPCTSRCKSGNLAVPSSATD